MFLMKKEFYTGIEAIDSEHSKLFEIIEEASELAKDQLRTDKYDQIKDLIDELRDYAAEHFSHEEAYMERIQYKRLFSQKMDHKMFLDKIDSIDLFEMDEHQDETIMEILEFLFNWLGEHILEKDMLLTKIKE